jgi:hypothetical protein
LSQLRKRFAGGEPLLQPMRCSAAAHLRQLPAWEPPGAKFCNSCGEKLLVLPQAQARAPTPPSTSAQPRAERRQLTVMFCDLVCATLERLINEAKRAGFLFGTAGRAQSWQLDRPTCQRSGMTPD